MSSATVGPLTRVANFAGRYLYAAGLVAYTFTLGLASPRRRLLISQLARAAKYPERPRPELPVVEVDAITRDDTTVQLPFPEESDGSVTLLELLVLARLVAERSPSVIFEIGTFDGRTTAALAANAPADAVVHTLDLPPGQDTGLALEAKERMFVDKPASGARVHASPVAHKVRQLLGDSAAFDFTPYAVDLAFIDGSHAYEYVLNDSHRALAMLRGGRGTVVWHDYGEWTGVTRALNHLRHSDPRFAGLKHVRGTTLVVLDAGAAAAT